MKETTFQSSASVPAGTKVALTFDQADARKASLLADDPKELAQAVEEITLAKKALAAARDNKDAAAASEAETYVADARANLQKRRIYTAQVSLFFKKGEVVGIERSAADFGRALTEALGVEPQDRPLAERQAERAPEPVKPKAKVRK